MISFWILNFTVLKISKWHNKINVCWTQAKRSFIKINFLVTSNGVLQQTPITQPSEERSLLQRLALISWCTQLNVLGQRFPGTSPRDQYPLSGIWEVIGWRAWDANYIMRLLHHKHNPGPCMYVYIYVKTCLPFREHDAEWDREGEKKRMINIQLTGQRFRCNYFRLPCIKHRNENWFVRKQ